MHKPVRVAAPKPTKSKPSRSRSTRVAAGALLALLGAFAFNACDTRPTVDFGSPCERAADCVAGLVCVKRQCSSALDQLDGGTTPDLNPKDAAAEADVAPDGISPDATGESAPDAIAAEVVDDTTLTEVAESGPEVSPTDAPDDVPIVVDTPPAEPAPEPADEAATEAAADVTADATSADTPLD